MPGDTEERLAGDEGEGMSSIRKLNSLSWDEKTETGMLRSRLEEQSQLICMLKRRADETLLKCHDLERLNVELEKRCGVVEGRLQAERKRGDQLEDRFGILAANHQDMIRFKDEYKLQYEELRGQYEGLRESKHPELLERDRIIRDLRAQLEVLESAQEELGRRQEEEQREREKKQEHEMDILRGRLEQLQEQNREQSLKLEALTQRLEDSEEIHGQALKDLSHLEEVRRAEQSEADRKVNELDKEKQELLQLCMERGRTLQERQREASELGAQLQLAEKARWEAEERYQRDCTAVNADARVSDLQRQLENGEKELEQLRRDFEAYKKHSGDLLAKERELNAKLRHLIG
ncbi:coiled-coil domain-containing protein 89 [Rhinophrynus dorsalis]